MLPAAPPSNDVVLASLNPSSQLQGSSPSNQPNHHQTGEQGYKLHPKKKSTHTTEIKPTTP
jgi:hypothetical protein